MKADFIKKVNGDVIDFNYGGKNQKLFAGHHGCRRALAEQPVEALE